MKRLKWKLLVFAVLVTSAGCAPSGIAIPTRPGATPSSTTPAILLQTFTPIPSITLKPLVTVEKHPSPTLTLTITPTPLNTVESAKVNATITALLREPGDCVTPCFWGIVPGKTTYDEANNFFYHLGISPFNTTHDGKAFADYEYHLNKDVSLGVLLTKQENVVQNQEIKMDTVWTKAKSESEWMAYSPKVLIQRYGKPSRVEFYWSLGQKTTFSIILYFDAYDLIGEFHSPDGPEPSSPKECPLAVRYDSIWLWMGKNPVYPPHAGVRLDEGTSLTIDEFSALMTGDPGHSCFNLNMNAFLPH